MLAGYVDFTEEDSRSILVQKSKLIRKKRELLPGDTQFIHFIAGKHDIELYILNLKW